MAEHEAEHGERQRRLAVAAAVRGDAHDRALAQLRGGASAALREVGLHDDDARKDIQEMRSLLEAWRDTRKGVWSTIVKMSTVAIITFIAASLWMQIGK